MAGLSNVDKAIYADLQLTRCAWDARMESAAHHRPSGHHGDGFVGVIYGDIGTTAFHCSVAEPVERNEFVQVLLDSATNRIAQPTRGRFTREEHGMTARPQCFRDESAHRRLPGTIDALERDEPGEQGRGERTW